MSVTFKRSLLGFALVHLAAFLLLLGWQLSSARGYVMADGVSPIGGDFINLWTAGRMVTEGLAADIYEPARFMELQQQRIGAYIGHRLWAYPPQSLALAVPFGALGYFVSLALWSLLGLAVLAFGARRVGFGGWATAILLLSPASLHCIYWGQTGNLACGLLLLALSQRGARDGMAVGATSLLTIKPQFGLLLPALWLATRQWGIIIAVTVAVGVVIAATLAVGGPELWKAYLFETLPELNRLERHGTGLFTYMIPSAFMALRIVTGDGDLAANLHLMLASLLLAWCLWHIWREERPLARHALVLVGTAAITPYLHIYDLTVVLAGAMMIARLNETSESANPFWVDRAVLASWALPYLTIVLNALSVPLSPLVMVALLVLLSRSHTTQAAHAGGRK